MFVLPQSFHFLFRNSYIMLLLLPSLLLLLLLLLFHPCCCSHAAIPIIVIVVVTAVTIVVVVVVVVAIIAVVVATAAAMEPFLFVCLCLFVCLSTELHWKCLGHQFGTAFSHPPPHTKRQQIPGRSW